MAEFFKSLLRKHILSKRLLPVGLTVMELLSCFSLKVEIKKKN